MATLQAVASVGDDYELPPRKRPKISDLPLSSTQRSSIDGMLHSFKKRGEFDGLRKKSFQQYNESAARGIFENALRKFTSDEIEREALKYLKPDRRLAAPLIEGAAARAHVYEKVEEDIDRYIEQYLSSAERALRDIRGKEIGTEQAEAEKERGLKSDEAYAQEAEHRREARVKKFADEERLRKRKEVQERKRKEIEALKKKQEELQQETERLQREQKRRFERDEWKKIEKERERERILQFNAEREKIKLDAEEREKALQIEKEKAEKEAKEREAKRLEQEALDRVLRAGREREELGRRPSLDRSGSMEPRSRYGAQSSRRELLPRRDDRSNAEPRRRSRSPPRRDEDDRRAAREHYREGTTRKESYYRDLSVEREVWKSKRRVDDVDIKEGSVRARSRSRDSRRRERSRTPQRRRSPPRTRERSRSPANIDRYVPSKPAARRPSRERSRERPRRERSRDRRDYSRDRRDRSRGERRDRSREHHKERQHDDDRRRRQPQPQQEDERPRASDIDRYVPAGESRRRERSRSRERRRDRSKDASRDVDKKDRK